MAEAPHIQTAPWGSGDGVTGVRDCPTSDQAPGLRVLEALVSSGIGGICQVWHGPPRGLDLLSW